jgi:hypothetical protein
MFDKMPPGELSRARQRGAQRNAELARERRNNPPASKPCSKCGADKLLDEYYVVKEGRYGRSSACKLCKRAVVEKWDAKNPERVRERRRRHHMRNVPGLSEAQFDSLVCHQQGKCAVCKEPCPPGKHLQIDRTPETGDVVSLLCVRCRVGVAFLRKYPASGEAAINYMRRHTSLSIENS